VTQVALSVVVLLASDTLPGPVDITHVCGCLDALLNQKDAPNMEVIVPYRADAAEVAGLAEVFPAVTFLGAGDEACRKPAAGGHRHHQALRSRALAHAAGEVVGLLEDFARPNPRWCAEAVAAVQGGYAAVGGAIDNDIDRGLNWAVYFCDFGKYQPPVRDGPSGFASDANAAYRRAALERIRPVWEQAFDEPNVNAALIAAGEQIGLSARLLVYEHRAGLRLSPALRERVIWARSFASHRMRGAGRVRRTAFAALTPLLPFALTLRIVANVLRKRRATRPLVRALPFIALLTVAWSWGEFLGYVTGQAD
jgi:hypothetical protein